MKVRKRFIFIILLTFSIIFAGPSYAEETNKNNSNNKDITVDVEKLDEMVKQFQDMDITKEPEKDPNNGDQSSGENSEDKLEMSTQIMNQGVGKGQDAASEEGQAGESTEEKPEEKDDEKESSTENPSTKKEEPSTEKAEEKPAVKKEEVKKEEEKQDEKTPIAKEPENPSDNRGAGESTGIIATLESLRSNADLNNIFSNTKESKGNVQVKSQKQADKRAVPTGNTSYADGILSAKSLIIIIAILAAIFSAISIAIKDRRYKKSKSE